MMGVVKPGESFGPRPGKIASRIMLVITTQMPIMPARIKGLFTAPLPAISYLLIPLV
jgi:hypothetical protein